MPRFFLSILVLGLVTSLTANAQAPKGNWKFRFKEGEQTITFLFAFTEDNGKWFGDFIGSSEQLTNEPKFTKLDVKDDSVTFRLTFGGREFINFDGKVAKDGKKISGSYTFFTSELRVTELLPSKLRKLDDAFAVAKEDLDALPPGQELFNTGLTVLKQTAAKKIPVTEVGEIADKLTKAAATYGPRWERTTIVKLANTLAGQEGMSELALAQARRAERMLTDEDPPVVQMEILGVVANLLKANGKLEDAKKYETMLARLEARDAADYAKEVLKFETPAYAGRKAKSDRVAVLEVFTGAECPPCAAVDVAFDGLLKTYEPKDVILLQYHFHVPGPDPLTNSDGMERVGFYAGSIRGAPTVFLNGKPGPRGGGSVSAAKEKYLELSKLINEELEKPANVKLALTAEKTDVGYTAKAVISDLAAPGEKVMLRYVLVEEQIRYVGGNGIRYHHHVVRAMPGGVKGVSLKEKKYEGTVAVNLAEIKSSITQYLDKYQKEEGEFPRADRPLDLKNLKLIALIQDDATSEILQAAQIDLSK